MLTIWGLLIVTIFMVLIMTKRTTPFTALVLSPVLIALIAGFGDKIGDHSLAGVKGVTIARSLGNQRGALPFSVIYDADGRIVRPVARSTVP